MEIQAKNSQNSIGEIPIDLLIDIFSRVTAKTIARCCCVSKLWRSILSRSDFMEVFLTMSSTHRRMFLFTIEDENNTYFFSAPEHENPDEKMCLVVPATRYHVQKKHSLYEKTCLVGPATRYVFSFLGFVSLEVQNTMVICNPSTGESVSLPEVEHFNLFLGYDPIDNQLKVLGVLNKSHEHLVLTLDNEKHLWRRNQCKPHDHHISNGICIDGILYYHAQFPTDGFDWENTVSKIVCFHVRSEKVSFINIHEVMYFPTLINYKGKLAVLQFVDPFYMLPSHLEFWVLEDAEKHKWSKRSYTLPLSLLKTIYSRVVGILGMTDRGEVVLASYPEISPFYICYFNLTTNHITRIHVQGLEEFEHSIIHTCLGYVENLKLMCPALRLDK